jgi:Zn-dependent protease
MASHPATKKGRISAPILPKPARCAKSDRLLAGLVLTALTIPLVDPLRSLAVNTLPQTGGYAVVYTMIQYQEIALASCLLNLLPLPGLACGAIWLAIWPGREKRVNRLEPIALAVLTAIIVSGLIGDPVPTLLPYFPALS